MMWIKRNNPALDATKTPSSHDIAWAAGFWEGEGSCRLTRKRSLCVTAVQKDPETLFRMREWFGGNVRLLGPSNKDCHVWETCGDRARIFLALIYSFLSARRKLQVNGTGALHFLGEVSPEGLSSDNIKNKLHEYYEEDRKKKKRSHEYRMTEQYRKYQREKMRKYRAEAANRKVVSISESKVS